MQTTDHIPRVINALGRIAVGILLICALVVAGLFWRGSSFSDATQISASLGKELVSSTDEDVGGNGQNRCELSRLDLSDIAEANHATDVLWGSAYLSRDGAPLSVEVERFETRPGVLPINRVNEGSLVLFAELLDSSGSTLHRYPFTMGGEIHGDDFSLILPGTVFPNRHREAFFQVFVPNPPEYDKIAITYSGKELWMTERSANAPVVNILTPECGSEYSSNNEITVSWAGGDADRDDVSYSTYYSIDGGLTFERGSLRYRDIAGTKQVHVRVYASDGTRASFDDTCFVLETAFVLDAAIDNRERCFGDRLTTKDDEKVPNSTDVISGTVWMTNDLEPIGLDFEGVRRIPQFLPFDSSSKGRKLNFELRNSDNESVYSSSFYLSTEYSSRSLSSTLLEPLTPGSDQTEPEVTTYKRDSFELTIPNPPEYDSIVIMDSSKVLWVLNKSLNAPVVEVSEPECSKEYSFQDDITVSWTGTDIDKDKLEYDVWYSLNGGYTYERLQLNSDNTIPAKSLLDAEDLVYIRVYATDGINTSFGETCFEYAAEKIEEEASTDLTDIQIEERKECQLDTTDIPEAKTSTESTDFIWGTMHVTDDGEPLRLESIEVRTYPGSWQPVEPDDGDHIFDIELRDASGESVYSAPIMVFGDWNAEFLVRIPDPPEYESIAILDSGRRIGEVWKSPNSPEIEIRRPEHGSVFCYEDVLRMLDFIRLSWSGDDRDGDELEYDIWISTDGGETYELTNTLRSNFHPSDLYGAEEVYARVYVTDGRSTAFDETYFVLDHGE